MKTKPPIVCRHGSLRRACEPCDLSELIRELTKKLWLEHQMKCELLECAPPGQGDHSEETCTICECITEGKAMA